MTMTTEDRTSRLEGAYEQVAERLNAVHGDQISTHERIDTLHERIDALRREFSQALSAQSRDLIERIEINRREARQDIRNLTLLMIALWGTTIAGVIAVLVAVLTK